MHDSLQLFKDDVAHEYLFSQKRISFVLGVVGVPQPPVGLEFKLQELMAEFSFVADAK